MYRIANLSFVENLLKFDVESTSYINAFTSIRICIVLLELSKENFHVMNDNLSVGLNQIFVFYFFLLTIGLLLYRAEVYLLH